MVMTIEGAFAETGKVLATSQHVGGAQSGEKFAGVGYGFTRIGGNGTGTHHAARGFEGKIEDGGEVEVEAEGTAVFSDELAVLAEKFVVTAGEDLRSGRGGAESFAEAIDLAAFKVDAS